MISQRDSYHETEHLYSHHGRPVEMDLTPHTNLLGEEMEMLDQLWRKWFGDQPFGDVKQNGMEDIALVFRNFEINPDEQVSVEVIDNKFKDLMIEIIHVLQTMEAREEPADFKNTCMIFMIFNKLNNAKQLILAFRGLSLCHTTQPSTNVHKIVDNIWKYMPNDTEEDLNAGQMGKIYALQDLAHKGYRRYKGNLVANVINDEGLQTCAWYHVKSIRDYAYSLSENRIADNYCWSLVSKGNGDSSVKNIIEWLENCDDPEVPIIKPDRHVFSFSNGVYLAKDEIFINYRDILKYFPKNGYPIACKHFDQPFDESALRYTDPLDIPTPAVEAIFSYQKWEKDVKRWAYVMIGRMIYDVHEFDDWQVMPFIKGVAGSGKSLLLNYIQQFYEDTDVGIISNIIEKQFGLSQMADKFIAIGDDLRENFQLDQTEFQNAISGNGVSCAQKFKDTKLVKPFKTQLIMSGNVIPGYHDNSGSFGRRMVVFPFNHFITEPDGDLSNKLRAELPVFLCKCNRMYRNMFRRMGHQGFWKFVPAVIREQKEELTASSNALVGFLSSNMIRKASTPEDKDSMYISLTALCQAVNTFATSNNLPKPKWGPDYYRGTLIGHGYKIGEKTERKIYPRYSDKHIKGPFVYGFDLEYNCEIMDNPHINSETNHYQPQPPPPQQHPRANVRNSPDDTSPQQQQQPPPDKRQRLISLS